jgi:hypothetical protein
MTYPQLKLLQIYARRGERGAAALDLEDFLIASLLAPSREGAGGDRGSAEGVLSLYASFRKNEMLGAKKYSPPFIFTKP